MCFLLPTRTMLLLLTHLEVALVHGRHRHVLLRSGLTSFAFSLLATPLVWPKLLLFYTYMHTNIFFVKFWGVRRGRGREVYF